MFFKKKDDKGSLPDLPPLSMEKFTLPKPEMTQIKTSTPELSGNMGDNIDDSEDDSENAINAEKQILPSFPDSPTNKGFSQSAIKQAVNDEKELPALPEEDEFPIQQEQEESETPDEAEEKIIQINRKQKPTFKTIEASESYYQPSAMMDLPKKDNKENIATSNSITPASISSSPMPILRPAEKNKDIYVKIDKFKSGKKTLGEINLRLEAIDSLLKRIREVKLREEQELAGWENEINILKQKLKDVTQNIFEKVE